MSGSNRERARLREGIQIFDNLFRQIVAIVLTVQGGYECLSSGGGVCSGFFVQLLVELIARRKPMVEGFERILLMNVVQEEGRKRTGGIKRNLLALHGSTTGSVGKKHTQITPNGRQGLQLLHECHSTTSPIRSNSVDEVIFTLTKSPIRK